MSEYDKDFKEIWKFDVNDLPAGSRFSPWAALRLKNGNTLITNEAGNSTIEVNPQKKIVWEFKTTDLPEEYRLLVSAAIVHPPRQRQYDLLLPREGQRRTAACRSDAGQESRLGPAGLGQPRPRHGRPDSGRPGIPEHPGESEH